MEMPAQIAQLIARLFALYIYLSVSLIHRLSPILISFVTSPIKYDKYDFYQFRDYTD